MTQRNLRGRFEFAPVSHRVKLALRSIDFKTCKFEQLGSRNLRPPQYVTVLEIGKSVSIWEGRQAREIVEFDAQGHFTRGDSTRAVFNDVTASINNRTH